MPELHSTIAAACAMLSAANSDPSGQGLSTSTDLDPFETLADHVGLGLVGQVTSPFCLCHECIRDVGQAREP